MEAITLLEETTRKSSSASKLRGSSGAREDVVPEEVTALKQQITDLQADRKGLVLAVRRLLKANQTEAQKKMLDALRRAKLQAQAAEKKLADMQKTDGAQIIKLEKLQKDTEEQLRQKVEEVQKQKELGRYPTQNEVGNITELRSQLHTQEVGLDALQKKVDDAHSMSDKLQAQVDILKEQNSELEEEKTGLEDTVKKLWHVNAPSGAESVLKVLSQEEERLKVVDRTRASEEKQFAEERSELSQKLSDTERRYKASEGLRAKNGHLAEALSKLQHKESDEVQAAQSTQSALQARLEKAETENQKLEEANQKLEAVNSQRKKEFEKLRASKDSDESVFVGQLTDLQKKVNDTEALVHQKEDAIKNVSARGMDFYVNKWQETEKALQGKIADEAKAKSRLEEKISDLSRASSKKDDELSNLSKEKTKLEKELETEKIKLSYAVDKENSEMASVDKLKAENVDLNAKLQKQKELELQLEKLKKHDEELQATNLELVASEKHDRDLLEQMQNQSGKVVQKALQEKSKLDFAVDQENTEMMAVKMLQSENKRLKDSLQDKTDLEAELKRLKAEETAKDANIEALKAQNSNTTKQLTTLTAQIEKLKILNGQLEDQYISERSKLGALADQESTESLALKVLQGENQKLKEELKKTVDDEANMAQELKENQAKAAAAEALETEHDQMRRELASLRLKEDALQRKNDELQETVAVVAAKSRDEQVVDKLRVAAQLPSKPVIQEATQSDVQRPVEQEATESGDKLAKASMELDRLAEQLRSKQAKQAQMEEADDA